MEIPLKKMGGTKNRGYEGQGVLRILHKLHCTSIALADYSLENKDLSNFLGSAHGHTHNSSSENGNEQK